MKKQFLFKLLPPRPTFNMDMDDHEKATMQLHMRYWADLVDKGIAILYGPVFDPAGVYGMAVIEVDHDGEAEMIGSNDPMVSLKICTYQLIPMMLGLVRK